MAKQTGGRNGRTGSMVAAALAAAAAGWAVRDIPAALGARPSGARGARVRQSPQFRDGAFRNEVPSPPRPNGLAFAWRVLQGQFAAKDRPRPPAPLPVVKTDLTALPLKQDIVIWLGHSSMYRRPIAAPPRSTTSHSAAG